MLGRMASQKQGIASVSGKVCVILTSQSLFAEGMASRLRRFLSADELATVDARQPNALASVIAAQPAAVLLDAGDEVVNHLGPLCALLTALPTLRIVQVDPRGQQVQVITSTCHTVDQAQDLIAILKAQP
jgi:hypothetical protein